MEEQILQRKDTDSPCIGTCSTVRGDDVCIGCYRTFDEVLLWHQYTDAEKRTINQRILQQHQSSNNDSE